MLDSATTKKTIKKTFNSSSEVIRKYSTIIQSNLNQHPIKLKSHAILRVLKPIFI